jgi:hypothetical protein
MKRGRKKASESIAGFIRDRIIRVLNSHQTARCPFAILDIAAASGASRNHIQKFVGELIEKGFVRQTGEHVAQRGHLGAASYEVIMPIPAIKHLPIARVKIWRSMRVMRRFTVSDLCATAEASNVNVRKYLGALVHGSYVRCIKKAESARSLEGHAIFALIKDTGPLAPKRASDGSIFDRNICGDGESGRWNKSGSLGCARTAREASRRP